MCKRVVISIFVNFFYCTRKKYEMYNTQGSIFMHNLVIEHEYIAIWLGVSQFDLLLASIMTNYTGTCVVDTLHNHSKITINRLKNIVI